MSDYPPLPEGFVLDTPQTGGIPPLPEGYTLDTPQPPEGNALDRFMTGTMKGYAGLGQLAGHAATWLAPGSQTAQDFQKRMDTFAGNVDTSAAQARTKAGLKPGDIDWYGVAGQVASPVNYIPGAEGAGPLYAAAKTTPGIGWALQGTSTLARIAQGAGKGAALGAGDTAAPGEDYWGQKAGQAGMGAAAGAIAEPVSRGIASAISPLMSRPATAAGVARTAEQQYADAAKTLLAEGIPLTAGQTAGGAGRWLEQASESIPLYGHSVREAQQHAAVEGLNRAVGNRILQPIGETLPGNVEPGHAMWNYIEDRIGQQYARIHPQVTLQSDAQLLRDIGAIWRQSATDLPADRQQQLRNIISDTISGRLQANNGVMPGNLVQQTTSRLGYLTKTLSTSMDADQKALGGLTGDLRTAIDDALERQNPAVAGDLRSANAAWRNLMTIQRGAASSAAYGREGALLPSQLASTVAAAGTKRQGLRGAAPMQNLAEAAKRVLGDRLANSGTAERAALIGEAATPAAWPALAGQWAAGKVLYSQPVQAAIRAAMTRRPAGAETLADIVRRYGPAAGVSIGKGMQ